MKKLGRAIVAIAILVPLSAACSNEHSESCEWERKTISSSVKKPKPPRTNHMVAEFEGKVGGSSGGGGRGGSSGSGSRGGSSSGGSSGGKVNTNKGGNSAPKYNRSNPAPKPSTPAGSGMKWEWDCE